MHGGKLQAVTDILHTYQILVLANFMLNKSVQYNTSHERIKILNVTLHILRCISLN